MNFFSLMAATIITADNIKIIEDELLKATAENLIIFDYDDVLIKPVDEALQTINESVSEKIFFDLAKDCDKNSIINMLSIITRDMKVCLVHQKWPTLIKTLQSRNIKTLLLTSCGAGQQGVVKSVENIRKQHLLDHGINFHSSWIDINRISFDNVPRKHYLYCNTHYCVFIDGMIFADGANKGRILREFLCRIPQYKFKKIIFIDNKLENLQSVDEACKAIKISFIGIKYNSSEKNKISADLEKIKKQYRILINEKRWVSDEELNKNTLTKL
jgi:hypothetical protein